MLQQILQQAHDDHGLCLGFAGKDHVSQNSWCYMAQKKVPMVAGVWLSQVSRSPAGLCKSGRSGAPPAGATGGRCALHVIMHVLLASDRSHVSAGEGIADGEQDHLFSLAGLKVSKPSSAMHAIGFSDTWLVQSTCVT